MANTLNYIWQNFERNVSKRLRELRKDNLFVDVTLCCDNGTENVEAHKVILAASSSFFKKILENNPERTVKSFLYLKGIKLTELNLILNFMYNGEVEVPQDYLDTFLAAAQDLAVIGLSKEDMVIEDDKKTCINQKNDRSSSIEIEVSDTSFKTVAKPIIKAVDETELQPLNYKPPDDLDANESQLNSVKHFKEKYIIKTNIPKNISSDSNNNNNSFEGKYTNSYHIEKEHLVKEEYGLEDSEPKYFTEEEEEDEILGSQDESIETYVAERNEERKFYCKRCGYKSERKWNVQTHVKSKHLSPGYPCGFCHKVLKTPALKKTHVKTKHES